MRFVLSKCFICSPTWDFCPIWLTNWKCSFSVLGDCDNFFSLFYKVHFLCVYRFCYGSISWLRFYHSLLFTGSLHCGQVKNSLYHIITFFLKIWSLIKHLWQSKKYNYLLMNSAFVGYEELKCRSRGVLSTEAENTLICTILHILQKPNSLIALLFIQNNSWFKNKLKHAYICRC